MTTIVPAATDGAADKGAAGASDGAVTLSDAQRRWCIGAAVVVMGLASLGTALYQSRSSDVDPASTDALAPLETSSAGAGTPGAAALPDPGLGGVGMPSPDALAPLSLMPGAAGGLPAAGGIPAGAGVPAYSAPPASQPRIIGSPPAGSPLASPAAPPSAQLPAAGAAAPLTTPGTAAGTPGTASRRTAQGPYQATGTPGVVRVAPGQAPPPGYHRVYPATPQSAATSGTAQQRSTQGTQPRYRSSPNATTPQQRRSPSTTPRSTTPQQPQAAPAPKTAPRSNGDLLGGLGG